MSEGASYIHSCCPWLTTFYGPGHMVAVLCLNLVGDALP